MDTKRLPWWTWVLPFVVLSLGTWASLPFTSIQGVYWIYFPINLAVAMTLWWGPRVLIAVFLNGLLAAPLLDLPRPVLYPIYAVPETLEVFMAWMLVKERFKTFSSWRASPKNITLFSVYGILIPSVVASALIQAIFVFTKFSSPEAFLWNTLVTSIGDMTGAVFITLPAMILVTPSLFKRDLSLFPIDSRPPLRISYLTKKERLVWIAGITGAVFLGMSAPFTQTWYVFGIGLLLSAAWYGLYAAILMNTIIMMLAVPLPKLLNLPWANDPFVLQTPATLLTLCYCSLLTGAAITTLTDKLVKLRETESELKAARDQAEDASQAKSEFLARMSHEIRTPLNSVLGMLELLKETQLSKDQARYLTLFSHAGENLKALINDLLDFSKIEAKALSVENVSYNLHATVRSVFEILQIKAEEKGLHFELQLENSVPVQQWGDPTRLRQVLFNLIGNALKFTSEGNVKVIVRIVNEGGEKISIEVQDTGIGIPREKQAKLFSPFFQADVGISRKYGGTGLGLVISKNLVEIMGGTLEMKSLAGRGTTFRILLPHRPDTTTHLEKKSSPAAAWSTLFPNKRFRILLVDDSEDNRVLIIHYLKNLPFDCEEAVNGQEAVEKFKAKRYDLIFMDMQMPIMTGYKATETIRHWEQEMKIPHTPIIALTATAVVEDLNRTLTSGCDAYAVKPVKKAEIVQILVQSLTTKSPLKDDFSEPPSATM
ncbi:hypothetical protein AZI85_10445 [Bdellovibrio bacteriovorus]|uniref:histidine kinase n=1 Tax=Bdellovibrio bacteriovorus TaxID=959 RepID=A0A150WDC7_BDEBC|nr:ATP-binding protein [Bdellovibrio bacteriovorus]KYG60872.1 hypothetical protein AZI85_10445 [Bdellovibrio bacteriovorus]